MRVFTILCSLLLSVLVYAEGDKVLNTDSHNTTKSVTIDRSKMTTIAEVIHELGADTLKEGLDNLLFNKTLRKALPYDEHPPILDKENCTIDARFNLKVDGLNVAFTNRSKGDFTHTEWIFGDGAMSHLSNATHAYDDEGLYVFSVIVYDNNTGCLDFFSGKYYLFDHEAMGKKKDVE